jgi:hypothetical protein
MQNWMEAQDNKWSSQCHHRVNGVYWNMPIPVSLLANKTRISDTHCRWPWSNSNHHLSSQHRSPNLFSCLLLGFRSDSFPNFLSSKMLLKVSPPTLSVQPRKCFNPRYQGYPPRLIDARRWFAIKFVEFVSTTTQRHIEPMKIMLRAFSTSATGWNDRSASWSNRHSLRNELTVPLERGRTSLGVVAKMGIQVPDGNVN